MALDYMEKSEKVSESVGEALDNVINSIEELADSISKVFNDAGLTLAELENLNKAFVNLGIDIPKRDLQEQDPVCFTNSKMSGIGTVILIANNKVTIHTWEGSYVTVDKDSCYPYEVQDE